MKGSSTSYVVKFLTYTTFLPACKHNWMDLAGLLIWILVTVVAFYFPYEHAPVPLESFPDIVAFLTLYVVTPVKGVLLPVAMYHLAKKFPNLVTDRNSKGPLLFPML